MSDIFGGLYEEYNRCFTGSSLLTLRRIPLVTLRYLDEMPFVGDKYHCNENLSVPRVSFVCQQTF